MDFFLRRNLHFLLLVWSFLHVTSKNVEHNLEREKELQHKSRESVSSQETRHIDLHSNGTHDRQIRQLLELLKPSLFPPINPPITESIGLTVIINTTSGRVKGYKKVSRSGHPFWHFLGIPYAEPPLGKLRFEPPEPHRGWSHIFPASTYGPTCMQAHPPGVILGSEDCLTLNIASRIVPRKKDLLPVMIFIHGGYFMSGASKFYPPVYFMDEEVILVTINYRLSVLGFLNTGDSTVTGNMGLKDQVMALKWIKENIINFNGDPERILLFGESAGSASVHLHTLSPMSQGLFSRAISQSGTALAPWVINRDPQGQSKLVAKALGCPTKDTRSMIKCLKKAPGSKFGKFDFGHHIRDAEGQNVIFKPTVEVGSKEPFLDRMPIEILKSKKFSKVPYIQGINSGEGLLYLIFTMQNDTLRNYVNDNWRRIGEYLLNIKEFSSDPEATLSGISKSYLKNRPISRKNIKDAVAFMSDAFFFLDNHDAALLHAQVAPVYLYFYKYNGIFALGELLFKQTKFPIPNGVNSIFGSGLSFLENNVFNQRAENKYGVCHGDELALLFNMPLVRKPIIFRDADYHFSKMLVSLWVSFAETGKPQLSKVGETKVKWEPLKKTNPDLEDVALTRLQINENFELIKEPFFDRLKAWKDRGVSHLNV